MLLLCRRDSRTLKLNIQTLGACAALALTALFAAPQAANAQYGIGYTSGPSFFFTSSTLNSGSVAGTPAAVPVSGAFSFPSPPVLPTITSFEISTTTGSAGTFEFLDATNKDVLSGTFTSFAATNITTDSNGTGSAQFGLGTVDYTGGSYLGLAGFSTATGTAGGSFSLVSTSGSGYVGKVQGGTFDLNIGTPVTSTPEPSGLIVFGILGAGLLGAVMLRRKQADTFAA
jgi:hypothetical protein